MLHLEPANPHNAALNHFTVSKRRGKKAARLFLFVSFKENVDSARTLQLRTVDVTIPEFELKSRGQTGSHNCQAKWKRERWNKGGGF